MAFKILRKLCHLVSMFTGYTDDYGHGKIDKKVTRIAFAWNKRGKVRNFQLSVEFYHVTNRVILLVHETVRASFVTSLKRVAIFATRSGFMSM